MTPDEAVFRALSASGIDGTRVAWPLGKAPPLPWFAYRREGGGELFADDANYAWLPRYRAELYMRENDPALRERFEGAVASLGPFTSNETWIPSESAYQVAYEFTYHPTRE